MSIDRAQLLAKVKDLIGRTPAHLHVCPPLQRAYMVRIAEELEFVSRETMAAPADAPPAQPEGGSNEGMG